ncbi:MAG: nucleotidyltransferase domain-containing protein [Candidatus Portnoybacteria bacterium]|nr:nucleotidyltransferase domain-containing protein [Candidatus Portnoybacteria bacterium]
MNHLYQKELRRITNDIIKNYKPEKIILFGSFAYGEPTRSSDIDLLIIKKTKKSRIERTKELLLMVDNKVPFEPVIYTPEEVDQRAREGDFFIEDILSKGKILYETVL